MDEGRIFEFRCSECGEIHKGSPSFGYKKPPLYFTVPEDEVGQRVKLTDDTCVIDDDAFFIRGLLEIPIHNVDDPFLWGVWVSQSRESFDRYIETYDADQSGHGSFGWLDVTMPGYVNADDGGETAVLACNVDWRDVGQRPLIMPQECDHQLYRDFADGITWERAIAMASRIMHG